LFDYKNASCGVYLFFIGLFKKVVLADTLAVWANQGFDAAATLTFVEAWITSLSYTLQLYFDFSGYTDMALGTALIFNFKLPINFDSPYKSLNIQEFWRRWHMTLGSFMRDYVYIPLGGSKVPEVQILGNLMITFLIIGIWHGAGWTFVLWGLMHGAAMIIHRLWKRCGITIPKHLSWFLTFNFINGTWVFFRAKDLGDAAKVLKGMAGLNGLTLPAGLAKKLAGFQGYGVKFDAVLGSIGGNDRTFVWIIALLLVCLFLRNSNEMAQNFKPNVVRLVFVSVAAILAILHLGSYSEFVYFRF
jgi:D-alanyl-lipoteichoic acid acyltransferase DltB (MBOAT superfamily)